MFALVGLLALLITESGLLLSNFNIALQQTFVHCWIKSLRIADELTLSE